MTVQRYVYRYDSSGSLEFHRAWYAQCVEKGHTPSWTPELMAERDARWDGFYEKEGGGRTAEISEAKLIGWKSAKKWRSRYDGSLIPARIVIE